MSASYTNRLGYATADRLSAALLDEPTNPNTKTMTTHHESFSPPYEFSDGTFCPECCDEFFCSRHDEDGPHEQGGDPPEHTHALADTFKASWDYDTLPKPLNGWAIEDAMFAWDDDDEYWVLHSIEEASFCGGDTPYNLTPRQIDALFFPGAGAPILADLLEGLAEDKWRAQQ